MSNRRGFLKTALLTGVAAGAPNIVLAQNKKYRTTLVGSGWWGMNITRAAIESGQCKLVAVADVDQNQLDPAVKEIESLTGGKPKRYKDYRELLDQEKPEIVIVATPDHWHPLVMIDAVKAGADVYVEKPIGHTILEGRAMVKAARNTGQVVQVGLHRRASPHNISGMKFLKEGGAGDIHMVRAFVHYGGNAGTKTPDEGPPAGLDWDMWCGPAPLRPYNPHIHPKGFRNYLDYANGTIADWGVHWFDQVLWWTEQKHPKKVFSHAAQYVRDDGSDAPDMQLAIFEFDGFTVEWENRRFAANNAEKHNLGCYFYGTKGTFHMGWRDGWSFYPVNANGQVLHQDPQLNEPDSQNIRELWANFLDCIKTRKRPICDIENGHHATNMSLLAMLSHRTGRSVEWDGEQHRILGDPEANGLLRRTYREPWVYP